MEMMSVGAIRRMDYFRLDLTAAQIFRSSRPRQEKSIVLVTVGRREIVNRSRCIVPLFVVVIPESELIVMRRIALEITVDRELEIGARNRFPYKIKIESTIGESARCFVDNQTCVVVEINVGQQSTEKNSDVNRIIYRQIPGDRLSAGTGTGRTAGARRSKLRYKKRSMSWYENTH